MIKRISRYQALSQLVGRPLLLLCLLGFLQSSYDARAADDPNTRAVALLHSSTNALNKFLSDPTWAALRNLMGGARAIYIAPHDTSGGFLITASGGEGVLLRRHGDDWSDPVFMHIGSVGVGFSGGLEVQSLITVIMTDAGVDSLISGAIQYGGGGGIALANIGVNGATGGSSLSGGLQVLTVSTAQGLFAGGDVGGTQISVNDAFNSAIYGPGYNLGSITGANGGRVEAAVQLRSLLTKAVNQAWDR